MNLSNKVKGNIKGVLIGLGISTVIISSSLGAFDAGRSLSAFKHRVYDGVETHKERGIKEKEFFDKTGLDVNRMSISEKYIYGKALCKKYIK